MCQLDGDFYLAPLVDAFNNLRPRGLVLRTVQPDATRRNSALTRYSGRVGHDQANAAQPRLAKQSQMAVVWNAILSRVRNCRSQHDAVFQHEAALFGFDRAVRGYEGLGFASLWRSG
jgi:hypothetical protein